jgi:hypothetical protein
MTVGAVARGREGHRAPWRHPSFSQQREGIEQMWQGRAHRQGDDEQTDAQPVIIPSYRGIDAGRPSTPPR